VLFTVYIELNLAKADASKLEQANVLNFSTAFTGLLAEDYSLLQNTYYHVPGTTSPFDAGMVVMAGDKETVSEGTSASLTIPLTTKPPVYALSNGNIIISYYIDPHHYALGILSTTNAGISSLLPQNTNTYFISTSGKLLGTTNKNISQIVSALQLSSSGSFQEIQLGNLHPEMGIYTTLQPINLGILMISMPVTEAFTGYIPFTLIGLIIADVLVMLLALVLYFIFINKPIQTMHLFLTDGTGSLPGSTKGSIGRLAEDIRQFKTQMKANTTIVTAENATQDNFLLLSGNLLRTPLTALQGYIDLLQENSPNKEKILDNMKTNVNKLIQLEENIHAVSEESTTIIQAKQETVSVTDVCTLAYRKMKHAAEEKHISFLLDTTEFSNINIKSNKENLIHAITNIIDNALKFTPDGGTIRLYGKRNEAFVVISVSDTGPGLTKEETEKVFDKFSRLGGTLQYEYDGLGLGLYIVKATAAAAGGSVWVDSIKGSGSIFNIMLPVA